MKKTFFTVGPSQLYPTVKSHIHTALTENIPSLSHRSKKFSDIYKTAAENLRLLMNIPSTHHIFFTSSALEGMERTIQNTVLENSFHFVNGAFSREFWRIAIDLKKNAQKFETKDGTGFDFTQIKIPQKTELIAVTQNETSTGVMQPMESIYSLKKRYPKKILAIDVVSSIPYVTIDFNYVDVTLFSVQKGFGLPAGLGVIIVNDATLKKTKKLDEKHINIGSYHNFLKMLEFEQKFQTRETPNVMNIYLLSKVTTDMLKTNINTIRKEIDEKAKLLYTFFDQHSRFVPAVAKPFRSKTTLVIDGGTESEKVIKILEKKGFVVAKGYGNKKDEHLRIGNFPSLSLTTVKNFLKAFPL